MATKTSRELAQDIIQLSGKSVQRIVRLAPKLAGGYLRLIARAGHDPAVVAAVERYLVAARRAEKHADDATRKIFAQADNVLAKRLAEMTGPDVELLGRELAHRRLSVLSGSADDAAGAGRTAGRAARGPDVGEAFLEKAFHDRLRSVAALGPAAWTQTHRQLLRGRRKLLAVIGGQWADGWEPTFRYLRDNADGIADRVRQVRAAEAALNKVKGSGSAVLVRAATEDVRQARRGLNAYLNKVKGLLGEAYVPRWKDWKLQVQGYLEVAGREARALPGKWEVKHVVGTLRIDNAEAWDEAILLVNRATTPPQVKLFMAAQYKVEKRVSALVQIQNDVLRETATASGRLPRVTFLEQGEPQTFDLTPMPAGRESHRHVFNAAGGRVSAAAIERLRAAGLRVEQLNLDVSVAEFDQVTQALADAVADTLP